MSFNELQDSYIPKAILYRDTERAQLAEVFKQFREHGSASNYLIFGYTGSGKTLILQDLMNGAGDVLYVSGARIKTSLKILRELTNKAHHGIDNVLSCIISSLKKNPKVLIIDELNQLRDPNLLFDYLNTIYREAPIPIILVSNKRDFAEKIADDARLTLMFRKLSLRPYNALEIKGILMERIQLIKEKLDQEVPEGFLNHVAAIATQQGSARLALTSLRQAIMSSNYSDSFIETVNQDIRFGDWREFFLSLSGSEKGFLKLLAESADSQISITTAQLFKHSFFNGLAPSSLSILVTTFEKQHGLIDIEVINKGRMGGRYRKIRFSSSEIYEIVCNLFKEEGIEIFFRKGQELYNQQFL